MFSILYCITEIARSYADKKVTFAMIYAVFSLPYIAIAYWGFNWLKEDSVDTRPGMLYCLGLKVICKVCVDVLMMVQLSMMSAAKIGTRFDDRLRRVQLGRAKLTAKEIEKLGE